MKQPKMSKNTSRNETIKAVQIRNERCLVITKPRTAAAFTSATETRVRCAQASLET